MPAKKASSTSTKTSSKKQLGNEPVVKAITAVDLCTGLSAYRKALENVGNKLGKEIEVKFHAEKDTYTIAAYQNLFGETQTLSHIGFVDMIPENLDFLFYSFSIDQLGYFESEMGQFYVLAKTLENMKRAPKYLISEMPKNLLSKNYISQYYMWENVLAKLGYETYATVLNATDFGLPQYREKAYVVSIQNDLGKKFHFPDGNELTTKLSDLLEQEVDKRYFLSYEQIRRRSTSGYAMGNIGETTMETGVAETLCARDYKDPQCVYLGTFGDKPTYRKLTPREYFRLMGFSDHDFDVTSPGLSNSRLYEVVGGSGAVPVLEGIIKNVLR